MKDLDFDELDRAVNSLMTNVPKSDVPKADEAEKTLDITPTLSGDGTPSLDKLSEATEKASGMPTPSPSPTVTPAHAPAPRMSSSRPAKATSAPAVHASTPLASRRSGRFMDVVHPSSDMKKPTPAEHPKVSRQGITIAPSAKVDEPKLPASEAPAADPKPEVLSTSNTSEVAEPKTVEAPDHSTPASDWPDPLEVANFKDEAKTSESSATSHPSAANEKPAEETQEKPEKLEEHPPLVSPFLSDAKVEKRPLGGSAPVADDEPDRAPVLGEKAGENLATADPEAQLPASPTETEPELPEELRGDLVEIEADKTAYEKPEKSPIAAIVPPAEKKVDTPWLPPKEDSKTEHTPAPDATQPPKEALISAPKEEKLLPSGPTSIAQQYHEEPSSGDQENGAIYDTDTYHQPLAHPAKKKSGWLWVVWIVAILLVGAGAGAALYFIGVV